ncbi:MAG: glutathione peroxidase [Gammaproteobacteria bacterium]|nr:glutathione peroxidase [Gammaproteobacteria bacterium]
MFRSMEGERVPAATFRLRKGAEWVQLTSNELFAGRTVVVFSLPGAFTPTCSSSHVPRYHQLAPALRAAGVDEIVCMSVNDAFVMNAWRDEQGADRVTFIPDGSGEFTRGMGLLVNRDDLGFGMRSWRYSMLVRDGVVEKMFIEPQEPGDPFKVSDADTMLRYLDPQAVPPPSVVVLSRPGCPHCVRAKAALAEAGLEYQELVLNRDFRQAALLAFAGSGSVPQVFVDGVRIGGADETQAWLARRRKA